MIDRIISMNGNNNVGIVERLKLTVLNGFAMSRFLNKYELLLRMINQFSAAELMVACKW